MRIKIGIWNLIKSPSGVLRVGRHLVHAMLSCVRSLLSAQHPLLSCCAACGEISEPVCYRLCASCPSLFQADAVYCLPEHPNPATETWLRCSLRSLDLFAPWISSVIIIHSGMLPAWLNPEQTQLRCVHRNELSGAAHLAHTSLPPEAYAHAIPGLQEYYLLCSPFMMLARPVSIIDFFTPNGVPLVFCAPDSLDLPYPFPDTQGIADWTMYAGKNQPVPGIYPQTATNSSAVLNHRIFAQNKQQELEPLPYFTMATAINYIEQRAIPYGGLHPVAVPFAFSAVRHDAVGSASLYDSSNNDPANPLWFYASPDGTDIPQSPGTSFPYFCRYEQVTS